MNGYREQTTNQLTVQSVTLRIGTRKEYGGQTMDKSEYNKRYHLEHLESERKRKLEWYYANKDTLDKEKLKEYHDEYYKNNKTKWKRTPEQNEKRNAARREKYATNEQYRNRTITKVKQYYEKKPHVKKAQRLKAFGLTLDDFNKLLEKQDYKCAICGFSDMSNKNYFPLVDHCHTTNKVRGLLCMNCNMGIGKLKDDVNILKSAIEYLERNYGQVADMVQSEC